MAGDTRFVFGLLLVTMVLFVSDRVRPDVIALLVILVLMAGMFAISQGLAPHRHRLHVGRVVESARRVRMKPACWLG
jgi:hypothetical protein